MKSHIFRGIFRKIVNRHFNYITGCRMGIDDVKKKRQQTGRQNNAFKVDPVVRTAPASYSGPQKLDKFGGPQVLH